ncbi:thiamine pyrophosphate-dependent dehydrogenase E1 component subunit alpha [Opitutales bacterium]|nr:thiamine pyrophosphate-dependent dehydrogenase E1 component subunit alpha [Opitutales bacterium]
MLLIRLLEEEIANQYPKQKMRCPTHLSIGQEAIGAAVGLILSKKDQTVSTHRAHAHYIGKGGDIKAMLAEIFGKSTGCSSGKGGSMHLIDRSVGFMGSTAIVGNTIPVGVGIGLSNKINKNNLVSCVFLGDAAVEEGVFHEAANFAVLHKLPVLFICENNLYSVYSPLHVRQPSDRQIYKWIEAYGMESHSANGNNPIEASLLISSSVEKIRSGMGPIFLEFSTYRWREHCGPNYDNEIGYRSVEEYEKWKDIDPLKRLKNELIEKGWLNEDTSEKLISSLSLKVEEAFRFAKDSPFPDQSDAYKHVLAEEQ